MESLFAMRARMGRAKDACGFVVFVKIARIRRMGRDTVPVDSLCLLSWLGWGGQKMPVDSFHL